jgi:GAF domain-containing protein
MIQAPVPSNEEERLAALYSYGLLDGTLRRVLESVVNVAADSCATDVSFVSLVDRDRQHFLASRGIGNIPPDRTISFCAHAMLHPEGIFEVTDATADQRFFDNPHVTSDNGIRFYAAQPLVTRDGYPLGGLCVVDRLPRNLTDAQRATLRNLGEIVMKLFDSHKEARL